MKFLFCVLSQEVSLWLQILYWLNAFLLYELAYQRSKYLNFGSRQTSFVFDSIPTHPRTHVYEWKWTRCPVWSYLNTHSHIQYLANIASNSPTKLTVTIFAKLVTLMNKKYTCWVFFSSKKKKKKRITQVSGILNSDWSTLTF